MRRFLYQLPLLLAALSGWTACSNDLGQGDESPAKTYTLTVDALIGEQSSTRGLTNDIKAVWSEGDVVTVLRNGTKIGTMTPQTTGSASTKMTAELTEAVSQDEALTLVFPRADRDYTGQTGTLADIAGKYDYATADVTVRYVNGTKASATDAKFVNQQAIVRFLLKDGSNKLNASSLTISANGLLQNATTAGDITITPSSPTDEIYAALSGVSGTVRLSATASSSTYSYTTAAAKTLANGKFYTITVQMKSDADPMLTEPLTLQALQDGTITFDNQSGGQVEYRRNNSEWTAVNRTISVIEGDLISFRGNNKTYSPDSESSRISCTGRYYVYGNIMSLISRADYATMTSLEDAGDNTFRSLFEGNTQIENHPEKDLLLPATTLQAYCYTNMFKGCTALKKAPVLPAPTLRSHCYQSMFEGCSRLAYIKCLATTIPSGVGCTTNWVKDVAGSGTFVKAAAMESWQRGDDGIPVDWDIK